MFTAAAEDVRTHHIQQAGRAALEAEFPGLPTSAGPPRTASGTSTTSNTAAASTATTSLRDKASPAAASTQHPPAPSTPSAQELPVASSGSGGLSFAAAPFVPVGRPSGGGEKGSKGGAGEDKGGSAATAAAGGGVRGMAGQQPSTPASQGNHHSPSTPTTQCPGGEVGELSFEETVFQQHDSDDEGQEAPPGGALPSNSAGGGPATRDASGQVASEAAQEGTSDQVLGTSAASDDTSHLSGNTLPSGMPRSEGQQIPGAKQGSTKAVQQQDGSTEASGDSLLGTSPTSISTAKAVNGAPGGDVFCYQAADGQWIFLDPLCVRILLAHYGSYEACPSVITAPVLDLETVEQVRPARKTQGWAGWQREGQIFLRLSEGGTTIVLLCRRCYQPLLYCKQELMRVSGACHGRRGKINTLSCYASSLSSNPATVPCDAHACCSLCPTTTTTFAACPGECR
jgi:hypothetical protein